MVLQLKTNHNAYNIKDVGKTMTVAELIEYLEQFPDDAPVYFNNDNGYTFGSINEEDFIYTS